MGMERFCNIKCRVSGLVLDAVVIVATTGALKMQDGGPEVTLGKPLHDTYLNENLSILEEGIKNPYKQNTNRFTYGYLAVRY